MQISQSIQNRIYEIRGERVMPACPAGRLYFGLATLYEVETRVFNQAVKRNIESFPTDFMFQMNIAIMRAFVEVRKVLLLQSDMKEQLKELKERVGFKTKK